MTTTQMSGTVPVGTLVSGAGRMVLECFGTPVAAVNDVQTITVDACTNSTLTLTNLPGGRTLLCAQDVVPEEMEDAINALLGDDSATAVTGNYSAGAGGTYIITWGGGYLGQPMPLLGVSATFVGGSSPAVAIVHTTPGVRATHANTAQPGALLVDATNGDLYINAGTQGVPVWTSIPGATDAATSLLVSPDETITSAAGATWDGLAVAAATATLTGTTEVTNTKGLNLVSYYQPTITDVSAVTVDSAATVFIEHEPAAAGSVTLTAAYALWVKGGHVRFTPTATLVSATSAAWDGVRIGTTTLTVTGTTAITTATGVNLMSIGVPTITDASACAITNAATLAIAGEPAAGGSATITNPYALWVQAGHVRLNVSATVASATSARWDGLNLPAATLTLSGSTATTTATGVNAVNVGTPSFTTAAAVTNAATVAIAGAPAVGSGGGSITNAYALWVQGGASRFAGNVTITGTATLGGPFIRTPNVVAALALDVTLSSVFTKAIATDSTFTASAAGTAGQTIILIISTDGTQRVATMGTNLNSSGTLTIPANKVGTISFCSDGTAWRETGRAICL